LPRKPVIDPQQTMPGERTRQKLIQAGIEIFGKYNFEATTTRTLADRAGVNLAAIPYHFKNKEGLYHAVIRHIVEDGGRSIRSAVSEINKELEQGEASPDHCFTMLCRLLSEMVSTMLGIPEAKSWAGIVLREQMEPTKGFDIIYGELILPVQLCCFRLIARIMNGNPDDPEIMLKAMTILGQLLIFRMAREAVVRTLKWEGYSPAEIGAVQNQIIENARTILGAQKTIGPDDSGREGRQ
jgi:TetR/AcrR family transcriptional regulator, regulator of cefoperazone and chloramphenicol sensitivity